MTAARTDGGCLCGAVRYRFEGESVSSSLCHCRSCRLASGATPVAWLTVERRGYTVTQGRPAEFGSSPRVTRTFCPRCGTPLSYRHDDDAQTIDITTATLDDPAAFPPQRELWLEDHVGWAATQPALAQHRRGSRDDPA